MPSYTPHNNQAPTSSSRVDSSPSSHAIPNIPGQVTAINGTCPITISSPTPTAPLALLFDPDLLMAIVKLPHGTEKNHWLSTHTVDFVRLISLVSLYLSATGICSHNTCGCMNCGGLFEYKWRADGKKAVSKTANEYIELLLQDVEAQINDDNIFPTQGRNYSEYFELDIQNIYRYLFRIFSHGYTAHYGALKQLGLDASFNTVFIHFMNFAAEFNLIRSRDLEPAGELLLNICRPIALIMAQKQLPGPQGEQELIQINEQLHAIEERFARSQNTELLIKQRELQARAQEINHPAKLASYFQRDSNTSELFSVISINPAPSSTLSAEVAIAHESLHQFYSKLATNPSSFTQLHSQYRQRKTTLNDFNLLTLIGRGSYGEVKLCQDRRDTSNPVFVIKAINKQALIRKGHLKLVCEERNAMVALSRQSEWLVELYETFQDKEHLYIIMEFCQGGDMMSWLIKKNKLEEPVARFYTAQLVMAVNDLHKLGFAHRDLKPQNILIGLDGHIKLADFGFAKRKHVPTSSTSTTPLGGLFFERLGSQLYVAPEVILNNGYDESVDWWAVGVILYEMVYGSTPFYGDALGATNNNILNHKTTLQFPKDVPDMDNCNDLIKRLINDRNERIGVHDIMTHPFFNGLNWETLRQSAAPFGREIKVESKTDTRYFDTLAQHDPTVTALSRQATLSKNNRPIDILGFTVTRNGLTPGFKL